MKIQTISQESHKLNDYGLFSSFLSRMSIVDYGIVQTVNGNRIDVQNITYPSGGSAIVTKDVELLFPSSSGLTISWEVKSGDTVLLLASRRYVKSLKTSTTPSAELTASGYDKSCLKAIPISFVNTTSAFTITEQNGMIQMKNQVASLATVIQNLITAIEGIVTTGGPTTQALNPASIAALQAVAAQFQSLLY